MARADTAGMFWNDTPPPKPAKTEKIKRIAPERIWNNPDYLPNLEEASAFRPVLFTDQELFTASLNKEQLVWDIESYPNFFLVAFRSIQSRKVVVFVCDEYHDFDRKKLRWVLQNFQLIDFNGNDYDLPIASIACTGVNSQSLYGATYSIIKEQIRPYMVMRAMKAKKIEVDHIDLIELTALAPGLKKLTGRPGLKKLTGRLHGKMMMDLPFEPGIMLSEDQKCITFWYCFNDLDNTETLYNAHIKNIELRQHMSNKYHVDLRSKSDAQMAEAIFRAEVKRITGNSVTNVDIQPGKGFQFQIPNYMKFYTPCLQGVLEQVRNSWFIINPNGYVTLPDTLSGLIIPIGESEYKFGIGGLHSREKSGYHLAGNEYILRDLDVASYYPKLILATKMFPPQIGPSFITIYAGIVEQRLAAKASGDKVTADGLKIAANGSFGKTLDPWSCLYFPELGIQTTLTGQLSILMLIECFELSGIQVINANTDGIVVKCDKSKETLMNRILKSWEQETKLEMEETDYVAIYSRDVNNYFAIKPNGEIKAKGVFGETTLKKNPATPICYKAVVDFIAKGIPISQTIRECKDFTQFVTVREVRAGGGVKIYPDRTEYLGKNVRWYYPVGETGEIVNANKGHIIAKSENGRPCMRLPESFPDDIDYSWYENESNKVLVEIGYLQDELKTGEIKNDED